jgi:hypothetical protein
MPSDSKPTLLADYDTEEQLAPKLGVCDKTLKNWRRDKCGPPFTVIAKRIYYYAPSVVRWLRSREQSAA